MQFDDAIKRREHWGSKLCNHPSLEKEYIHGSQTGDYVCTQCGRVVELEERSDEKSRATE